MADNDTFQSDTIATLPAGTKVSSDEDVTNGKVQRMKLAISADGSSTHIPADAANGLDVDVTRLPDATTPAIYNVTMTDADTEYSQALPANTKRFSLQCLTDFDIRFAFVTGKAATPTAPYARVRAGMNYYEDTVNLASSTLYFACADAAKVAEVIAWT